MNRHSKQAQAIAATTGSTPHRIERWSIAGLFDDDETPEQLAARVRALQGEATQGRDYDRVAFRLASRHSLGCRLYPEAIMRALSIDDPETEALCSPVDHDEEGAITDVGAVELERRASAIAASVIDNGGPVVDTMVERIAGSTAQLNEPPEYTMHSVMTSLASMAAGEPLYPSAPLTVAALGANAAAYLNPDGDGVGGAEPGGAGGVDFLAKLGDTVTLDRDAVRRYLVETPPAVLAATAHRLHTTLEAIGPLLGAGSDLDTIAAVVGPVLAAMAPGAASPLISSLVSPADGIPAAALAASVQSPAPAS